MRAAATSFGAVLRGRTRHPRGATSGRVARLEGTAGYDVVNAHGPVGVVQKLQRDACGEPTALVIGAGSTMSLVLLLPLDRIASIDEADRRVTIDEDRIGDYVPAMTGDGKVVLRPPGGHA